MQATGPAYSKRCIEKSCNGSVVERLEGGVVRRFVCDRCGRDWGWEVVFVIRQMRKPKQTVGVPSFDDRQAEMATIERLLECVPKQGLRCWVLHVLWRRQETNLHQGLSHRDVARRAALFWPRSFKHRRKPGPDPEWSERNVGRLIREAREIAWRRARWVKLVEEDEQLGWGVRQNG